MGRHRLVRQATDMKVSLIRSATLVLAVILLGLGLRLFHLDGQSFWYDEAMSAGISRGNVAQILRNDFYSPHPPLYFLALHSWLAIGQSDFAIRLLSAVLGVAGIAGMFALGKALCDDTVGLVAATITAIAPYHVFYSQEARMYALLFLMSTMLLVSYARMLQTNSRRWWAAYTALAALSVNTHLFSGLLLLSLHLHFLVHGSPTRKPWRRLAISDGVVILAILPRFSILVAQARRVTGDFWIPRPGLGQLFSAPHAFILSHQVSERLVSVAFAVLLFLVIVTHLQIARAIAKREAHGAGLVLAVYAFWSPMLLVFLISQWRSVYLERTLIVAVPALYFLLGWGMTRTRERYVNIVLGLLVALFALDGLHNWYFNADFAKPPFRTAAQFLRDRVEPGEPVLHTSDGGFLIFAHYARDLSGYLLEGDPDPGIPVEVYRLFGAEIIAREELPASPFWVVVALDNSIEFQTELANWFDRRYQRIESYDFGGVDLRHYDEAQPSLE
jgi:mannosyltransferase